MLCVCVLNWDSHHIDIAASYCFVLHLFFAPNGKFVLFQHVCYWVFFTRAWWNPIRSKPVAGYWHHVIDCCKVPYDVGDDFWAKLSIWPRYNQENLLRKYEQKIFWIVKITLERFHIIRPGHRKFKLSSATANSAKLQEVFRNRKSASLFILFIYLFAIFILHSRESELYRYTLDGKSALAWELPFLRFMGHLSST